MAKFQLDFIGKGAANLVRSVQQLSKVSAGQHALNLKNLAQQSKAYAVAGKAATAMAAAGRNSFAQMAQQSGVLASQAARTSQALASSAKAAVQSGAAQQGAFNAVSKAAVTMGSGVYKAFQALDGPFAALSARMAGVQQAAGGVQAALSGVARSAIPAANALAGAAVQYGALATQTARATAATVGLTKTGAALAQFALRNKAAAQTTAALGAALAIATSGWFRYIKAAGIAAKASGMAGDVLSKNADTINKSIGIFASGGMALSTALGGLPIGPLGQVVAGVAAVGVYWTEAAKVAQRTSIFTGKALSLSSEQFKAVLMILANWRLVAGAIMMSYQNLQMNLNLYEVIDLSMARIQTKLKASNAEMTKFQKTLSEISGQFGVLRSDLAAAADTLIVGEGMSFEEAEASLKNLSAVTASTGLMMAEVTRLMTDAADAIGSDNLAQTIDRVATAYGNSSTNLTDMATALQLVGRQVLANTAETESSVLTLIGTLQSMGLDAQQSGGELAQTLGAIQGRIQQIAQEGANGLQQDLSVELNVSEDIANLDLFTNSLASTGDRIAQLFQGPAGEVRSLLEVLPELRAELAGMGEGEQGALLQSLFGQQGQMTIMTLLKASQDEIDRLFTQIESQTGEMDLAGPIENSYAQALARFQSALEDIQVKIAEAFEPVQTMFLNIASSVLELTEVLNPIVEKVLLFTTQLAPLFSTIAVIVGPIAQIWLVFKVLLPLLFTYVAQIDKGILAFRKMAEEERKLEQMEKENAQAREKAAADQKKREEEALKRADRLRKAQEEASRNRGKKQGMRFGDEDLPGATDVDLERRQTENEILDATVELTKQQEAERRVRAELNALSIKGLAITREKLEYEQLLAENLEKQRKLQEQSARPGFISQFDTVEDQQAAIGAVAEGRGLEDSAALFEQERYLQERIEEAGAEYDKITDERQKLNRRQAKLEAEIEATNASIFDKQVKLQEVGSRAGVVNAQSMLATIDQREREADQALLRATDSLLEAEKRVSTARQQLESARSERESVQGRKDATVRQYQSLRDEQAGLLESKINLQDQLGGATADEASEIQKRLESIQNRIVEINQERLDAAKLEERLSEELERQDKIIAKREDSLLSAEAGVGARQADVDMEQQRRAYVAEQSDLMRSAADEGGSPIRGLIDIETDAGDRLIDLTRRIVDAAAELDQKNANLDATQDKLDELSQSLSDTQTQLIETQGELYSLEAERPSLTSQLVEVRDQKSAAEEKAFETGKDEDKEAFEELAKQEIDLTKQLKENRDRTEELVEEQEKLEAIESQVSAEIDKQTKIRATHRVEQKRASIELRDAQNAESIQLERQLQARTALIELRAREGGLGKKQREQIEAEVAALQREQEALQKGLRADEMDLEDLEIGITTDVDEVKRLLSEIQALDAEQEKLTGSAVDSTAQAQAALRMMGIDQAAADTDEGDIGALPVDLEVGDISQIDEAALLKEYGLDDGLDVPLEPILDPEDLDLPSAIEAKSDLTTQPQAIPEDIDDSATALLKSMESSQANAMASMDDDTARFLKSFDDIENKIPDASEIKTAVDQGTSAADKKDVAPSLEGIDESLLFAEGMDLPEVSQDDRALEADLDARFAALGEEPVSFDPDSVPTVTLSDEDRAFMESMGVGIDGVDDLPDITQLDESQFLNEPPPPPKPQTLGDLVLVDPDVNLSNPTIDVDSATVGIDDANIPSLDNLDESLLFQAGMDLPEKSQADLDAEAALDARFAAMGAEPLPTLDTGDQIPLSAQLDKDAKDLIALSGQGIDLDVSLDKEAETLLGSIEKPSQIFSPIDKESADFLADMGKTAADMADLDKDARDLLGLPEPEKVYPGGPPVPVEPSIAKDREAALLAAQVEIQANEDKAIKEQLARQQNPDRVRAQREAAAAAGEVLAKEYGEMVADAEAVISMYSAAIDDISPQIDAVQQELIAAEDALIEIQGQYEDKGKRGIEETRAKAEEAMAFVTAGPVDPVAEKEAEYRALQKQIKALSARTSQLSTSTEPGAFTAYADANDQLMELEKQAIRVEAQLKEMWASPPVSTWEQDKKEAIAYAQYLIRESIPAQERFYQEQIDGVQETIAARKALLDSLMEQQARMSMGLEEAQAQIAVELPPSSAMDPVVAEQELIRQESAGQMRDIYSAELQEGTRLTEIAAQREALQKQIEDIVKGSEQLGFTEKKEIADFIKRQQDLAQERADLEAQIEANEKLAQDARQKAATARYVEIEGFGIDRQDERVQAEAEARQAEENAFLYERGASKLEGEIETLSQDRDALLKESAERIAGAMSRAEALREEARVLETSLPAGGPEGATKRSDLAKQKRAEADEIEINVQQKLAAVEEVIAALDDEIAERTEKVRGIVTKAQQQRAMGETAQQAAGGAPDAVLRQAFIEDAEKADQNAQAYRSVAARYMQSIAKLEAQRNELEQRAVDRGTAALERADAKRAQADEFQRPSDPDKARVMSQARQIKANRLDAATESAAETGTKAIDALDKKIAEMQARLELYQRRIEEQQQLAADRREVAGRMVDTGSVVLDRADQRNPLIEGALASEKTADLARAGQLKADERIKALEEKRNKLAAEIEGTLRQSLAKADELRMEGMIMQIEVDGESAEESMARMAAAQEKLDKASTLEKQAVKVHSIAKASIAAIDEQLSQEQELLVKLMKREKVERQIAAAKRQAAAEILDGIEDQERVQSKIADEAEANLAKQRKRLQELVQDQIEADKQREASARRVAEINRRIAELQEESRAFDPLDEQYKAIQQEIGGLRDEQGMADRDALADKTSQTIRDKDLEAQRDAVRAAQQEAENATATLNSQQRRLASGTAQALSQVDGMTSAYEKASNAAKALFGQAEQASKAIAENGNIGKLWGKALDQGFRGAVKSTVRFGKEAAMAAVHAAKATVKSVWSRVGDSVMNAGKDLLTGAVAFMAADAARLVLGNALRGVANFFLGFFDTSINQIYSETVRKLRDLRKEADRALARTGVATAGPSLEERSAEAKEQEIQKIKQDGNWILGIWDWMMEIGSAIPGWGRAIIATLAGVVAFISAPFVAAGTAAVGMTAFVTATLATIVAGVASLLAIGNKNWRFAENEQERRAKKFAEDSEAIMARAREIRQMFESGLVDPDSSAGQALLGELQALSEEMGNLDAAGDLVSENLKATFQQSLLGTADGLSAMADGILETLSGLINFTDAVKYLDTRLGLLDDRKLALEYEAQLKFSTGELDEEGLQKEMQRIERETMEMRLREIEVMLPKIRESETDSAQEKANKIRELERETLEIKTQLLQQEVEAVKEANREILGEIEDRIAKELDDIKDAADLKRLAILEDESLTAEEREKALDGAEDDLRDLQLEKTRERLKDLQDLGVLSTAEEEEQRLASIEEAEDEITQMRIQKAEERAAALDEIQELESGRAEEKLDAEKELQEEIAQGRIDLQDELFQNEKEFALEQQKEREEFELDLQERRATFQEDQQKAQADFEKQQQEEKAQFEKDLQKELEDLRKTEEERIIDQAIEREKELALAKSEAERAELRKKYKEEDEQRAKELEAELKASEEVEKNRDRILSDAEKSGVLDVELSATELRRQGEEQAQKEAEFAQQQLDAAEEFKAQQEQEALDFEQEIQDSQAEFEQGQRDAEIEFLESQRQLQLDFENESRQQWADFWNEQRKLDRDNAEAIAKIREREGIATRLEQLQANMAAQERQKKIYESYLNAAATNTDPNIRYDPASLERARGWIAQSEAAIKAIADQVAAEQQRMGQIDAELNAADQRPTLATLDDIAMSEREVELREQQAAERAATQDFNAQERERDAQHRAEQRRLDRENAEQIYSIYNKPGNIVDLGGLPARREGGPVAAGQTYLVGEEGPELFTPGRAGGILPADQTAALMGGLLSNRPNIYAPTPATESLRELQQIRKALSGLKPGVGSQQISIRNSYQPDGGSTAAMVERSQLDLLRQLQKTLG